MSDITTIELKKPTRDELRKYKAEDGITYDEAVRQLLKHSGWEFSDEE